MSLGCFERPALPNVPAIKRIICSKVFTKHAWLNKGILCKCTSPILDSFNRALIFENYRFHYLPCEQNFITISIVFDILMKQFHFLILVQISSDFTLSQEYSMVHDFRCFFSNHRNTLHQTIMKINQKVIYTHKFVITKL